MDPISNINVTPQPGPLIDRSAREYLPLDRAQEPIRLDDETAGRDLQARLLRARQTANAFEAIFIRQLLKTMQTTLGGEGMFGSGQAGEMYSDMVDDALADALSEKSFLGISDMMYRRMIQEIGTVEETSEKGAPGPLNDSRS